MDDDRLASELERRSRAASPRPDWAQRDLLPAVSREIDARPQPVVTSRWSPRLGVAALVAALLIMVVAVPRLVPAPPTSSSSPANGPTPQLPQAGVLSTADFAARLAAGDLDGETVLVDGRIGQNFRFGPLCSPSVSHTRCYMGPLENLEPQIDVFARWNETNAVDATHVEDLRWETWHFPATPQEGFLLLSVDASGRVEFVGLARDSGPGPAWSVADADAQHLDVNTVDIDEVILVRGWLVETEPPGTTISIDCMTPEFPPVDGLPYNYCLPQDFLSSEQPVDELTPRGAARISVQRNAAQLFNARMQDGTSLFAIAPRLYGGGSCGTPTCWEWDVVARVDQLPEPLPGPTPQIAPEPLECGLASPRVFDETGLAEDCTATQALGDGLPVTISNPDGDAGYLEILWGSVPACGDGPESLTLRARTTGYELLVVYTRTDTLCDGVVYETRVVLRLSEPIPAETVIVSTSLSEPSPSPQPDLNAAWWELAPTERPTDASTQLSLVVFERGCSGGQSPAGRVLGPTIAYGELAVTITFEVTPLAGDDQTCPTAPGEPVSVQLSEPLGTRILVDGGFASQDRVLEHDDLLWVAPMRGLEQASARFDALLGADFCDADLGERPVDTADLERLANEAGVLDVPLADGMAWVGSWNEAIRGFGGTEIYMGRDRDWWMIAHADGQPWLPSDLRPGSLVLADITSVPISGSRSIWIPGRFHRTVGPLDCGLLPEPTVGTRTFICAGSEALGDSGIKLVDHSGRIGACSMANAESVPGEGIEVSTTRLPGQLAVNWTVNAGCPGDQTMEFWGPVDQPIGLAEYVLNVARTTIVGETCTDLVNVRRVQLGFTVFVQPSDIRALVTAESASEGTTSAMAGEGSFDLLLAAPLALAADEPIDITVSLTNSGSDQVTLSGWWQPDFIFVSLTGGPSLEPNGQIAMCPDAEIELSSGQSVVGDLAGPQEVTPEDPNFAYRDEYAYDGQFRLPAGTYLIVTGVAFEVGSHCEGDHVSLRTAIVIHVGGFASSGAITHTPPL